MPKLTSPNEGGQNRTIHHIDVIHSNLVNIIHRGKPTKQASNKCHTCDSNESYKTQDNVCAIRILRIVVNFAGTVGGLSVIEVIETR